MGSLGCCIVSTLLHILMLHQNDVYASFHLLDHYSHCSFTGSACRLTHKSPASHPPPQGNIFSGTWNDGGIIGGWMNGIIVNPPSRKSSFPQEFHFKRLILLRARRALREVSRSHLAHTANPRLVSPIRLATESLTFPF